ncbi:sodium:solute symporter [Persicobacter psychrovividus]|uniref:Sodium/glucose cotransporter 2 n=1 Tax=Persicobacter psychrovividus TaxID=387638 RepID=A0ABM7VMC3_9BACT|nr:sodium/glucose cotransporter 2 [Persicobacter psychrovividus]
MSYSLSNIDLGLIIVYVVGVIVWALMNSSNDSSQDYFLAGRNMKWPAVGLSLFAASVSSSTLIGQSAEAFKTGIAVYNYQWISILVMVVFATFFLPFYLKSKIFTMPEFLERRFDKRSRYYFSAITIIGNVFLDAAAALYAGAMIIKLIYPHAELQTIILFLAIAAGIYTIPGGLSSAINAELIQAVILIIGSIILAYLAMTHIGGWDQFYHRFDHGVWMQLIRPMHDPAVPWLGMIVGIPILGFYFWGNNQVMVQRVLSAKSIDHGRKGVLFVGVLYIFTLFIFIMPGLAARAMDLFDVHIPATAFGKEIITKYHIDVNEIYPRLIMKLMPVGLVGIVIAAMISALTSTLSATLNSASTLFTLDFYSKIDKKADSKKLVRVGQITSTVILIIAILWAPNIQKFGSLVDYYQEMLSYLAPPVVGVFFLGLFNKRVNAKGAFVGLVSGLIVAIFMLSFKDSIPFIKDLHFLLIVPILLIINIIITLAVSYSSELPPAEKVEKYTWTMAIWREESEEFKSVVWYKNFRYLALGLMILSVLSFVVFI